MEEGTDEQDELRTQRQTDNFDHPKTTQTIYSTNVQPTSIWLPLTKSFGVDEDASLIKEFSLGSLSVLVPRPRDRWKLDLQFSHRSNFLFHPPTRDFKLVSETVVPGRTPARSKGNHCLFSVSSGAAVAMGDLALMSKTDWYCEVSLPESLKLFARRVSSTLETNMATRRRRGIRNPWVLPPRLCVQWPSLLH